MYICNSILLVSTKIPFFFYRWLISISELFSVTWNTPSLSMWPVQNVAVTKINKKNTALWCFRKCSFPWIYFPFYWPHLSLHTVTLYRGTWSVVKWKKALISSRQMIKSKNTFMSSVHTWCLKHCFILNKLTNQQVMNYLCTFRAWISTMPNNMKYDLYTETPLVQRSEFGLNVK